MSYPSRTICDVLNEMRATFKTCNFSTFPSLIEELQTLGNRMEARLDDQKDYFHVRDELRKLNEKKKTLQNEVKLLTEIKERT